ncbi:unnamed protein product [Heterosigma akashiwo]
MVPSLRMGRRTGYPATLTSRGKAKGLFKALKRQRAKKDSSRL